MMNYCTKFLRCDMRRCHDAHTQRVNLDRNLEDSMTGHARSILPVFSFAVLLCISTSGSAQDAKPKPTGSISGHIIINSKGAAGIEVGAIGGDNFTRRLPAAQTKTDSEGFYRLEGLTAGNYQVITFTP